MLFSVPEWMSTRVHPSSRSALIISRTFIGDAARSQAADEDGTQKRRRRSDPAHGPITYPYAIIRHPCPAGSPKAFTSTSSPRRSIERDLADLAPEIRRTIELLSEADGHPALARHLGQEVARVLGSLPQKERLEVGRELISRLIGDLASLQGIGRDRHHCGG
jgi:hypothetical protein